MMKTTATAAIPYAVVALTPDITTVVTCAETVSVAVVVTVWPGATTAEVDPELVLVAVVVKVIVPLVAA